MSTVQAQRHPVDRLAEEFVERYRRGERPAIGEYTAKYPELASELQEILAALVLIEEHGRARVSPVSGSANGRVSDRPAPVQLGEYRVLREIGRGGMGIVYEAVQESLGRHVALKVLPAHALLDSVRLKRFQHEAQAAARLHHTNIVPIFGVGTDEGVHFYAMQFIQGRGLDEIITELRALKCADGSGSRAAASGAHNTTEQAAKAAGANLSTISDTPRFYRSVATLGAQVAEALDHAHRQGVTHRDIKPSNLLLDTVGTVWITDFGLAKSDGTEELTHSGDLVGTLRYMAPEQLHGKGDGRADIYSLGSTLFELLTLRAAFDASDRAALVRQIVQDDPPRPRKLDPRIPRDLETIVLKAMAHDPASRYAKASEMAVDLQRFLDDKPIAARPVSVSERLWRWCLRRPALASLAAALLLSLSIGVAGVLWQWGRAKTHLQEAVRQKGIAENMLHVAQQQQQRAEKNAREANKQRTIAQRQAAEVEANYQTARKAVNELLTMVSEDDLLAQPGLQPLRLQLLTRALQFYEERLAGRDQDPVARRDLALSYLRLGSIKQQLGPSGNEAADAYRQAIALLRPSGSEAPGNRAATILLARAENSLAIEQIHARDLSGASSTLGEARQRLLDLLHNSPDDDTASATLAMTYNNLGFLLSESSTVPRQERFEGAIEYHQHALEVYRRVIERHPDNFNVQYSISNSLSNMARRQAALARHDKARALLEECLRIRQGLAESQPGILEFQWSVGATFNSLGDVIRDSRLPVAERVKQAIEHYQQAMDIGERLVRQNPAVLRYRQELANIPENVSDLCARYHYDQQALEWRLREIAAWDACLALDPANAEIRAKRANRINGQAALESRLGQFAAALDSCLRAREAWREIEQEPAQLAANRVNLLSNLAGLMLELGRQNKAAELLKAAEERRRLSGDSPGELLELSYDLERAFRAIARASALDESAAAKTAAFQQLAVQLFRDAAKRSSREADQFVKAHGNMRPYFRLIELDAKIAQQQDNAGLLISRARWLEQLGDLPGCEEDRRQAMLLLNAQLEKTPDNANLTKERALLYFDDERWAEAVADATRALVHQPNDLILLRLRARAHERMSQWQPAFDDLTTILTTHPEKIFYWPERCHIAIELGHESEAIADAGRLIELAKKYTKNANSLVWEFMARGDIARYPEAALALAHQAAGRHPDNVYRGEIGGVHFYLANYRKATEYLIPAAAEGPSESSAICGFWLAMSHHHLGEAEKAKAALERAVRNWKVIPALRPEEEKLFRSLWQEARTFLGDATFRPIAARE